MHPRPAKEGAMPSGYRTSDVSSRYQPLLDHLEAATGDAVALTYREVAALIGGPLPESAILGTSWWTSRRQAHVQAWRALGWRAHSEREHLRVRFTREGEAAQ